MAQKFAAYCAILRLCAANPGFFGNIFLKMNQLICSMGQNRAKVEARRGWNALLKSALLLAAPPEGGTPCRKMSSSILGPARARWVTFAPQPVLCDA
jgi:hypothetical protein